MRYCLGDDDITLVTSISNNLCGQRFFIKAVFDAFNYFIHHNLKELVLNLLCCAGSYLLVLFTAQSYYFFLIITSFLENKLITNKKSIFTSISGTSYGLMTDLVFRSFTIIFSSMPRLPIGGIEWLYRQLGRHSGGRFCICLIRFQYSVCRFVLDQGLRVGCNMLLRVDNFLLF